ncbi:MAG: hypothetical protein ACLGH0_01185 [Thermoanaerobaculia bacterium]
MRAVIIVLLLALGCPAFAQEFTIFDINDFVDPRELGAVTNERGSFACPCVSFLTSRAIVGWDRDFINVMQPTATDIGFAHVATSYYRGPIQINSKVTVMRDVHRSESATVSRFAVPREAIALQFGHYRATELDDETIVRRYQLSWRVSRYLEPTTEDGRGIHSVRTHEFGAEMDVRTGGLVGSLTYTIIADETADVGWPDRPTRLAYTYRFDAIPLRNARLEPTFTFGILGRGLKFSSRFTAQAGVRLVVPLGSTGANFNVRVAPTVQRFGGWHDYYEISAFLDRHIFAVTW